VRLLARRTVSGAAAALVDYRDAASATAACATPLRVLGQPVRSLAHTSACLR
jgi:hypothetical protein